MVGTGVRGATTSSCSGIGEAVRAGVAVGASVGVGAVSTAGAAALQPRSMRAEAVVSNSRLFHMDPL